MLSPKKRTKKFEKWKKKLIFDPEKRIDWELNVLCGKLGDFSRFMVEKLKPKGATVLGMKKQQAGGDKLPYRYWAWNFGTGRARAAVYSKADVEVVLVVHWTDPGGDSNAKDAALRIRGFWKDRIQVGSLPMLETFRWQPTSGFPLPAVWRERDFLNSPERRVILDRERAMVAGHVGWSLLATRRFLVKFSHGGDSRMKGRMQTYVKRLLGDFRSQEGSFRRFLPPPEGFEEIPIILRVYHPQAGGDQIEHAVRQDPRCAVSGSDDTSVQVKLPWNKQSIGTAWNIYIRTWLGGSRRVHDWVLAGLAEEGDVAWKKSRSVQKKNFDAKRILLVQEALSSDTGRHWDFMLEQPSYFDASKGFVVWTPAKVWQAQGTLMVQFLLHAKERGFHRQPYKETFHTYLNLCRTLEDPVKAAKMTLSKLDDKKLEEDWRAYVEGLKK